MQEYRYSLLIGVSRFYGMFGLYRPVRYEQPVAAGDYDHALHVDHPEAPSISIKISGAAAEHATRRAPQANRALG